MSSSEPTQSVIGPVDYDFWSQMSGWTTAEAAALLLDIDPDRIPEKSKEPGTPGWAYERLRRLLARARKMDELSSPMSPREFLTWATSNKLKPPDQLIATVRAGRPHRNWRTRYLHMKRECEVLQAQVDDFREKISDDIHPRAMTSLLRLIGGMARAGFKHTTNSPHTVAIIASKLDERCYVNKTVIKKYLNLADEDFMNPTRPK